MTLHWLMALLIIATFFLGLTMVDMPGITPTKLKYFNWHKWMGVTVLGLAVLRVLWRFTHRPPALPAAMPKWEKIAAELGHLGLYVLMFAVPLSGYFYSLAAGFKVVYLGLFPLPVLMDRNPTLKPILEEVHYWLNMGLAGLVSVHFLAVLKHQFIDRNAILKRMLS
jgi:cytochrome b561